MNSTLNGKHRQEIETPTKKEADIHDLCELPIVIAARSLLADCLLTGSIGAIVGPNGCGKTIALKFLEHTPVDGSIFRLRCCQQEGSSRGVRDLLMEMGAAGIFAAANQSMPLAFLCKIALRTFEQRNVRALLLDEADLWDAAALSGLVTLLDQAAEKGRPIAAILTGSLPPQQWIQQVPSLDSRTFHIVRGENLSLDSTVGLLETWGGPFPVFSASYEAEDSDAMTIAEEIHAATGGNPRRLNFLASLLIASKGAITLAGAKKAIRKTSR